MKVVSLFAGIGGFDLGFTESGFGIVAHVEIDPQCRKLLTAKWPGAVCLDDVRTAGAHNLPACDVVVGGSPCQSFSVAGLRKGLNDPRGNLLLEYLRVVSEMRPKWMVWENVPGVLSDKTKALYSFLDALEKICYVVVGLDILDAQFFGVAQRRRRIFICAQSIESLRSQKTSTSASIFLQCLTEILQSTLTVLKGRLTHGAEKSDCGNGLQLHSIQRRMKLFGLLTEEQASPWLNNLDALLRSSGYEQGDSESLPGLTSRQDATIGRGTSCDTGSKTEKESVLADRQSIDASWRSTLENGLAVARSCITSTAPSETTESKIFMCAEACLTIARFTQDYLTSSLNYWKTATSSLTTLKEFIEYARKTSSDLFGDVGRVCGWDAFIREAEELCAAFERAGAECFGSLFPLEKGVFWHPAPSREAGQGVAGRAADGTGIGGEPDVAKAVRTPTGGIDREDMHTLIPAVAGCLQERDAKGADSDKKPGHLIAVNSGQGFWRESDHAGTLGTEARAVHENNLVPVAFDWQSGGDARGLDPKDVAMIQRCQVPAVAVPGMQVRRLTPTECERLQGFPDGWTAGFSDSVRYRMLGNAVAVPCAAWIARRIKAYEEATQ